MAQATKPPKFSAQEASNLYERAHAAGMAAGEKARPAPMYVVERENPFDDNSPIKRAYPPVMDGVCGFAWINIKPGNSSFANWLKATTHARKDSYYGGVSFWVREFGQSYERKIAYAHAFAEILREAGVKAFANGRLD